MAYTSQHSAIAYTVSNTCTIRMSNSLNPDQGRHSVGPDLGPNCLQWLSADDKSPLAAMKS